jgi:hypothetical protein
MRVIAILALPASALACFSCFAAQQPPIRIGKNEKRTRRPQVA